MADIKTETARIKRAKGQIAEAIEGKGVSVPSSALIDEYPALIEAISSGGSNIVRGEIAVTSPSNSVKVVHGIGKVPFFSAISKNGADTSINTFCANIDEFNGNNLGIAISDKSNTRMSAMLSKKADEVSADAALAYFIDDNVAVFGKVSNVRNWAVGIYKYIFVYD